MNRANFFKSLLTIIVAPKVIIDAFVKKDIWSGETERLPESIYFEARTNKWVENREWANSLSPEQKASLAMYKLVNKYPPSGKCIKIA